MTEMEIERAFYNLGQLKGHIDGLHDNLKKPEECYIAINRAYKEVIDVMQAGTKAIRKLRAMENA